MPATPAEQKTEQKSNPAALPYLAALNPEQRQAVEALDGPLLVLAGAGTGKTRVLTTRLGHLLRTGTAQPHQILAVTFTNKAAQEMRERVSQLLDGRPVEGWWIGTFHSLAARMLRRHAERAELENGNFTILDTDDQMRLMKQIAIAEGVDVKKHPPRMMAGVIDGWKNRALRPEDIGRDEAGGLVDGKMPKLYKLYQERLLALNACDFGDLLLHMITIFKNPKNSDILRLYQDQFRYILVDEYQDTNTAQYLWLRLLAQKHKNICCVGDDDQSIYGWRGADIGNILRFEEDFPQAKIVRLEQNYRSTPEILQAANAVIAHNAGRMGKKLWSASEAGEKINLRQVWDGPQEAAEIGEEIENLQRRKHRLNEIAVLVRAGYQTREFEERFMTIGLPYRVIGGPRFYERMEIRDAIAYFRLVMQPSDDLAFERIINTPKRGVGPAALESLHSFARQNRLSLFEGCLRIVQTDILRPKLKHVLSGLMQDFLRWRAQLAELPPSELAGIILEESGYIEMWKQDKSVEAPGRLENLKELVAAVGEFENIGGFLEHVALVMEMQQNNHQDMVTIMTLHAAKGLEFDTVFLPGWEEGVFPSQRTLDENGMAGLEEERRLAYVGLTRARKNLYIFHAQNRMVYGNWSSAIPSRFLGELPEELVEAHSDSGVYYSHQSRRETQFYVPRSSVPEASAVIDVQPSKKRSEAGIALGSRVTHDNFGKGTVIGVEGNKLDIRFDNAGRKKLMERFVQMLEG
ncbi:MAG: UvrD-helicase domain-containing protein [Pseudomonadota bacterium]|nr:DNA helicase II [Pseudomonadota bacterium]QKK06293.1 MAG: UvrD-helicase domain-containing protein [Pseudomonadota bacterium]